MPYSADYIIPGFVPKLPIEIYQDLSHIAVKADYMFSSDPCCILFRPGWQEFDDHSCSVAGIGLVGGNRGSRWISSAAAITRRYEFSWNSRLAACLE